MQRATVAWPHLGRQGSNLRVEGCLALVRLLTILSQSCELGFCLCSAPLQGSRSGCCFFNILGQLCLLLLRLRLNSVELRLQLGASVPSCIGFQHLLIVLQDNDAGMITSPTSTIKQ